ncbi:hypothetical protein ACFFRR_006172 [Megaselia abdita]
MKVFLLFGLCVLSGVLARPEPPVGRYGPPAPQKQYGPPAEAYGPPAETYGPPAQERIVTKNVYVHVPPEEPEVYAAPSQPIVSPPKKHYKIIFIKAPNPPTPQQQVAPVQPQDEHKTLVYVLVKKPEPQPELVIPAPAPTEPSKPEVYFIKYKNQNKPAAQYGPPPTPAPQYGPPPTQQPAPQYGPPKKF